MATLTETAYYTRKGAIISAIALIGFVILKIALNTAGAIWLRLHPPPPPPPTVAFGILPKPVFSDNPNLAGKTFNYRLETISGGLPNLTSVGKVYFMPKETPNLLALDRATARVNKMGFRSQPTKISDSVFQWSNEQVPPSTLDMDINNGSFHIKYPYETDQSVLDVKNLPTNQQAAQEVKTFLLSNNLLADDLASGSAEFDYLKFTPDTGMRPAVSLSEADFVRVNMFRTGLDNMKILPPNPHESLVSFLFSGAREPNKRIIEVKYNYFPIEQKTFATYPLKTATAAWEEMKSGKGYVANLGINDPNQITIREIYLAYYDSEKPQHFLQPIFVFEGDKNFFGYVPAVDPKWMEK